MTDFFWLLLVSFGFSIGYVTGFFTFLPTVALLLIQLIWAFRLIVLGNTKKDFVLLGVGWLLGLVLNSFFVNGWRIDTYEELIAGLTSEISLIYNSTILVLSILVLWWLWLLYRKYASQTTDRVTLSRLRTSFLVSLIPTLCSSFLIGLMTLGYLGYEPDLSGLTVKALIDLLD